MTLTLKNLVLNALYYGITVAILPVAVLRIEDRWWGAGEPRWILRAISVALGGTSVLLQGWCIVLLQRRGRGTPSPIVPAEHLVTEGPYAWLRNPLNLGEVLLLVALAAWFASWLLLAYVGVALVAFHLFIVAWEEPRHRALFGQPYLAYAARVGRWLPHPPPSEPWQGRPPNTTAAILLWAAAIAHIVAGNVDYVLAGTILIGSVPGVWFGSHMSIRLPAGTLRTVLGVVLIGAALGLGSKAGLPIPPVAIAAVPLLLP